MSNVKTIVVTSTNGWQHQFYTIQDKILSDTPLITQDLFNENNDDDVAELRQNIEDSNVSELITL